MITRNRYLLLLATMLAAFNLSGMEYSPNNPYVERLQLLYNSALNHTGYWNSFVPYLLSTEDRITVPCGHVAQMASKAAHKEKGLAISLDEATTHIIAAVQKCQNLAGHIVENEQTIFTNVVIPFTRAIRMWKVDEQEACILLFDHG